VQDSFCEERTRGQKFEIADEAPCCQFSGASRRNAFHVLFTFTTERIYMNQRTVVAADNDQSQQPAQQAQVPAQGRESATTHAPSTPDSDATNQNPEYPAALRSTTASTRDATSKKIEELGISPAVTCHIRGSILKLPGELTGGDRGCAIRMLSAA
jgi:hypothetical protein